MFSLLTIRDSNMEKSKVFCSNQVNAPLHSVTFFLQNCWIILRRLTVQVCFLVSDLETTEVTVSMELDFQLVLRVSNTFNSHTASLCFLFLNSLLLHIKFSSKLKIKSVSPCFLLNFLWCSASILLMFHDLGYLSLGNVIFCIIWFFWPSVNLKLP